MSNKKTTIVRRVRQGGRRRQRGEEIGGEEIGGEEMGREEMGGEEMGREEREREDSERWKWDVGSMFACLHLAMILAILCLQYKFGVSYGWTSIWT